MRPFKAGLETRLFIGALWAVVVVAAHPLLAHHSFAMFDTAKRVTMSGSVTAFEWTNPHVYIEIDVPDEKGVVKHWSVELGSPSILMQAGWTGGSVSFRGELRSGQTPDYQKLYHAAEIRSRSAATG